MSNNNSKKNNILTYSEDIECDGLTYKFNIVHALNSLNILMQLIDSNTGITINPNNYIFRRDGLNTSILEFKNPPIAREKYTILLIKI